MIDKAWRAVSPLTIHSCFKKSGFPSPNLVDVDDTLTELNAEPSLWEALPEQDLTFEDNGLVDTDIAVWGALSDAEIVALNHNNTESDEDEEAKVSLNKLRNFSLQNLVDADILQASFVLEKFIDKIRLNALKQKKITGFFRQKGLITYMNVGSGRPRETSDREARLIVRLAVTAPDLSLSTIRRATRIRVSTITIHRRLLEQNLRSYRSPLTPAECRARLQRCLARSDWNHAEKGSIVFSDESR
ncbi:tigger transposable element-derived protein 6 [Trichonephila clavipes]|nr:tigger transposable element-derived protein 6 [Trichonephila clavipes]